MMRGDMENSEEIVLSESYINRQKFISLGATYESESIKEYNGRNQKEKEAYLIEHYNTLIQDFLRKDIIYLADDFNTEKILDILSRKPEGSILYHALLKSNSFRKFAEDLVLYHTQNPPSTILKQGFQETLNQYNHQFQTNYAYNDGEVYKNSLDAKETATYLVHDNKLTAHATLKPYIISRNGGDNNAYRDFFNGSEIYVEAELKTVEGYTPQGSLDSITAKLWVPVELRSKNPFILLGILSDSFPDSLLKLLEQNRLLKLQLNKLAELGTNADQLEKIEKKRIELITNIQKNVTQQFNENIDVNSIKLDDALLKEFSDFATPYIVSSYLDEAPIRLRSERYSESISLISEIKQDLVFSLNQRMKNQLNLNSDFSIKNLQNKLEYQYAKKVCDSLEKTKDALQKAKNRSEKQKIEQSSTKELKELKRYYSNQIEYHCSDHLAKLDNFYQSNKNSLSMYEFNAVMDDYLLVNKNDYSTGSLYRQYLIITKIIQDESKESKAPKEFLYLLKEAQNKLNQKLYFNPVFTGYKAEHLGNQTINSYSEYKNKVLAIINEKAVGKKIKEIILNSKKSSKEKLANIKAIIHNDRPNKPNKPNALFRLLGKFGPFKQFYKNEEAHYMNQIILHKKQIESYEKIEAEAISLVLLDAAQKGEMSIGKLYENIRKLSEKSSNLIELKDRLLNQHGLNEAEFMSFNAIQASAPDALNPSSSNEETSFNPDDIKTALEKKINKGQTLAAQESDEQKRNKINKGVEIMTKAHLNLKDAKNHHNTTMVFHNQKAIVDLHKEMEQNGIPVFAATG